MTAGETLEAERQKRVDHLQQIAARRIGQMVLARGWSAWHSQFEEQQWRERMLLQAGGRLMRPKLFSTFAHWRNGFESLAETDKVRALEAWKVKPLRDSNPDGVCDLSQSTTP